MTEYDETAVRVSTIEEWKAVLDAWFKEGHDWYSNANGKQKAHADYFTKHSARYLVLEGGRISQSTGEDIDTTKAMSFNEFMAKEWDMITYEVSEEQLGFIKEVKDSSYPAAYLTEFRPKEYKSLFGSCDYTKVFERDLLRHIGGDENVVFQLKEPLYFLKGKNNDGDNMYFTLDSVGAPTYTYVKSAAFKAPHDEIVPWENPFWKIEPVDA